MWALYHVCAGWRSCLLPSITPDSVVKLYLLGTLAHTDHRTPKRRWQLHHLHVLHMFRLQPVATHVQYVPSGLPFSVPNALYLSVLLLSFSHTSPVLPVQPAHGPFLSPLHTQPQSTCKKPPPCGSRGFFIKIHSDWQETYLHIKLTST